MSIVWLFYGLWFRFTRVREITVSVRVNATTERSSSNCFARLVYTAYKKQRILHLYSKGYKAPTIPEVSCYWNLMCRTSSWYCKDYQGVWAYGVYLQTDCMVQVDHQRLLVRWKYLVEQQGVKLEIKVPPQQSFGKNKGGLIFKRSIILSEYSNCSLVPSL